ncbi:MAG: hypothetical protein DRP14_04815 [Candidatus Aenigmatarchaeota archaeon]|nr:MAG: hypothetical protein DRP14_04815 [Candidatus Aenigmarchaeota archaeon]
MCKYSQLQRHKTKVNPNLLRFGRVNSRKPTVLKKVNPKYQHLLPFEIKEYLENPFKYQFVCSFSQY